MVETPVDDARAELSAGSIGTGAALAIGLVSALAGIFLLPWVTSSQPNGANEALSLGDIRAAMAKDGFQHFVIDHGLWVLIGVVVATLLAIVVVLPERITHEARTTSPEEWMLMAGVLALGAAWVADAVFLAHRLLSRLSKETLKAGLHTSVGIGAWVTLAGTLLLLGAAISRVLADPGTSRTQTANSTPSQNIVGDHSTEVAERVTQLTAPPLDADAGGRVLFAAFLHPGDSLVLPDRGATHVHSAVVQDDGSTLVWLRDGQVMTYPEGARVVVR